MSSEESLEERLAPFLSTVNVVVQSVSTTSAMLFVHGIYAVIFGICLRLLMQRRGQPNRTLHLGWTTSLFILSTMLVIMQSYILIRQSLLLFTWTQNRDWEAVHQYLRNDRAVANAFILGNLIPFLVNAIADTVLIHRCYIMWDSNVKVALPMCFAWLVTNAGLVALIMGSIAFERSDLDLMTKSEILNTGYFITNVIINGLITLCTAGRIWKINRQARAIADYTVNPYLKRIIAIILESGALYPVVLIAYLVVDNTVSTMSGIQPINLAPVVTQVAGIAPTLIIVRAARVKATPTVDQVMSTIDFQVGERDRDSRTRLTGLERTHFSSSSSDIEMGPVNRNQCTRFE